MYQARMIESPKCTFCNQEDETITHLFVECSKIQVVWNYVENLIQRIKPGITLNPINKLMGLYREAENEHFDFINHLITITKNFIHKCRLSSTAPTINGLLHNISDSEYLERQIAVKRGKIVKHNEKWQKYLDLFE